MTVAHSGPLHPEKAKQWKFEIAIFYFLGNTFIEISSKKISFDFTNHFFISQYVIFKLCI